MLILASCANADAEDKTEILVAAASSMTPALTEIAAEFENNNKDIRIAFSFGSSGKLAQQIKNGAPVDVFISASTSDMDKLENESLIESDTRSNLTSNSLVVIEKKSANETYPEDPYSSEIDHFAIGNPDTVPAGVYAKEGLIKLGKWDALEPKFVYGKDVRQVLTFVETGNADRGIVFRSDAQSSGKVEVVAEINAEMHSPAVYPGAVIRGTEHPDAAKTFLDYMKSSEVQQILTNHGFTNLKR